MDELEVFADIACPFTHVGLRRFVAQRAALGRELPVLRVRAWPLELVNGEPLLGAAMAPKVDALRRSVAPDCFAGFDAGTFPGSTLPALASVAAAYRAGPNLGERFSLGVREALFELGRDPSDPYVLAELRAAHGVGEPTVADGLSVLADFEEGAERGVLGSPHFFTPDGDFFCPSLEIAKVADDLVISLDEERLEKFLGTVLA
jgi:predicted DsbA family dithiol-disulfide isomerase